MKALVGNHIVLGLGVKRPPISRDLVITAILGAHTIILPSSEAPLGPQVWYVPCLPNCLIEIFRLSQWVMNFFYNQFPGLLDDFKVKT